MTSKSHLAMAQNGSLGSGDYRTGDGGHWLKSQSSIGLDWTRRGTLIEASITYWIGLDAEREALSSRVAVLAVLAVPAVPARKRSQSPSARQTGSQGRRAKVCVPQPTSAASTRSQQAIH